MEKSVRRLIPRQQCTVSERGPGNGAERTARDSRHLLRFRLHPSAIVGDVTQTFLQLVLDKKKDRVLPVSSGTEPFPRAMGSTAGQT